MSVRERENEWQREGKIAIKTERGKGEERDGEEKEGDGESW